MTPGNELLFLALGGSGEIGMNVNLYGCQGKWVMVDLGLTFADPAYPGVELVLPDLSFIEDRRDDRDEVQPEIDVVRTRAETARGDPDLGQVDQARDDREQQAEGDQPRCGLDPEDGAGLRVDDVEDHRGDEEAERDGIEEAIDGIGHGGTARCGWVAHGFSAPGKSSG